MLTAGLLMLWLRSTGEPVLPEQCSSLRSETGAYVRFSGPATRQRVVLVLAPVQLSPTSSSLGTFSHGSSLSSAAGIGPLLRRTLSPWAAGSKMCQ